MSSCEACGEKVPLGLPKGVNSLAPPSAPMILSHCQKLHPQVEDRVPFVEFAKRPFYEDPGWIGAKVGHDRRGGCYCSGAAVEGRFDASASSAQALRRAQSRRFGELRARRFLAAAISDRRLRSLSATARGRFPNRLCPLLSRDRRRARVFPESNKHLGDRAPNAVLESEDRVAGAFGGAHFAVAVDVRAHGPVGFVER